MIGASECEVRYEAQIQRLLRRPDASTRRILCLSAVFPSGTELDDFVAWITDDEPDGLHREAWRPMQQRFGLVEWLDEHARLTITLGPDRPYIPRYLDARQPTGRRMRTFPADQRELVIATGWRLVEEGQTVLVFCPNRTPSSRTPARSSSSTTRVSFPPSCRPTLTCSPARFAWARTISIEASAIGQFRLREVGRRRRCQCGGGLSGR